MKTSIDRAIEKVPGCVALVDGVLNVYNMYIPLIYGESGYTVEGTPLIDPALAAGQTLPSDRIVCRMSKAGEVEDLSYVSREEYDRIKRDSNR